jgi:hypothetical protein
MRKNSKALLIQLCGEVFIIGGTVSAMIAAFFILDPGMFGSSDLVVEPIPKLVALPFLLLTTCVGFVAGIAVWICTMQRFSNRAQLQKYLTEPHIPLASDFMEKLFDLVYDAVQKPYRLEQP